MNPPAYGAQESVLMNAGLAEPDSGKVDLSGELCARSMVPSYCASNVPVDEAIAALLNSID